MAAQACLPNNDLRDAFAADYNALSSICLLYTSDAADERSSVDLGGRRIIKKKNRQEDHAVGILEKQQNTVRKYH